MNKRVIFESDDSIFRILEIPDINADFENLCGDTYNPKANPDIPPEKLKAELAEFTDLVNREGVFGYELQKWNPKPGIGWEHVDSCWGFVGQYSETEETFKHYIVDELKSQAVSRE